jgi:hypothetical protein
MSISESARLRRRPLSTSTANARNRYRRIDGDAQLLCLLAACNDLNDALAEVYPLCFGQSREAIRPVRLARHEPPIGMPRAVLTDTPRTCPDEFVQSSSKRHRIVSTLFAAVSMVSASAGVALAIDDPSKPLTQPALNLGREPSAEELMKKLQAMEQRIQMLEG